MDEKATMSFGHAQDPVRTDDPVNKIISMESGRETSINTSISTDRVTSESSSPAQPYHVPQFSAGTSMILNRIKNGSPGIGLIASTTSQFEQNASNNARTWSAYNANSTTLPAPQTPQSPLSLTLPLKRSSEPPLNPGTKRKRGQDAEKVDFTQNTMAFPTPVPMSDRLQDFDSHRRYLASIGIARCLKCDWNDSTPLDPIIMCTGCSGSWHKGCASPAIPEPSSTSNFLCLDCTTKGASNSQNRSDVLREQHIDRMREKQLANLPQNVVPPKPGLVGFRGEAASGLARTEYFYGKSKAELLNILSFCDQLKPQLLVDLLVSVSRKHPDLPIFDSPDWYTQVPSASKPKLGSTARRPRAQQRPRHGHIISTKHRQRVKTGRRSLKDHSTIEAGPDGELPEAEEDSMPSTWPSAGQGLYAKLVPEVEDRLFLADENDEEAFSHFMVDKLGKQIVEPV